MALHDSREIKLVLNVLKFNADVVHGIKIVGIDKNNLLQAHIISFAVDRSIDLIAKRTHALLQDSKKFIFHSFTSRNFF